METQFKTFYIFVPANKNEGNAAFILDNIDSREVLFEKNQKYSYVADSEGTPR